MKTPRPKRRKLSADESSSAAEAAYQAEREQQLRDGASELLHGIRLADAILLSIEQHIPDHRLTDYREFNELVEKFRDL